MPGSSSENGLGDKLRATQVNPVVVAVVATVLVLGAGYLFWLRPAQNIERARREWTSAAAQEARSPEGRAKAMPAEYKATLQRLRAEEAAKRGGS